MESPARDFDQVRDDFECEGLFFLDQGPQASDEFLVRETLERTHRGPPGRGADVSNLGGALRDLFSIYHAAFWLP
jgi:hypothetical protein